VSNRTLLLAGVVTLVFTSRVFAQQSCETLATLKLTGARVTSAATVTAAPLAGPANPGGAANAAATVPAHCEVKLTIHPTNDSEIKAAVWLPVAGWNGKYQQVGNGGSGPGALDIAVWSIR